MKLPPGHVAGQGVAKPKCTGGFGERMLRTMGWEAGQGLGKEGTGIREAIQVKKKEDTVGVGGNGSYAWGDKWWEKAFDSAAQTVGDSGSSSDSSDSDSDDEHAAAIAACVNRDGTRTSASADELRLLASLSKGGGGRVAAGRFGGRDAKMARIRQQEAAMAAAAAAKLGVPSAAASQPSTAAAGAAGQGGSERSDTTSEVRLGSGGGSGKKKRKATRGAGAEASSKTGGKSSKKPRSGKAAAPAEQQQDGAHQQQPEPTKKQRIVIEPVVAATVPLHPFVPTPATGWWGAARFASAGCLEGLDQAAAEAQRRRTTFDEDDQARIYNTAQARKTQGRVGLGQGSGPVKVGGVRWEGKRVSFEEAEGGGEPVGGEEGGDGARLAAVGSCTHLDALAAQQQQQRLVEEAGEGQQGKRGEHRGERGAAAGGWEAAVKWRKIIAAQLQAAEQRQLKRSELQRRVVAAVLAKHGGVVSSKAAVRAAFAARLEGSGRFVVEGSLVRLRS